MTDTTTVPDIVTLEDDPEITPRWEQYRVPGQWAIVELMGHRVRAGTISDIQVGGATLLRIQHPTVAAHDGLGPLTECYSPSALFSIRPCSRVEAIRWAETRWQNNAPTPAVAELTALSDADVWVDDEGRLRRRGPPVSGGSYNYLCSKDALDLLGSLSSQEDLARMADRLTELGYDDGVAHDIRLLIGAIDTHRHAVDEVLSRLEPVLHAVEWLDSGDWGEEQVRDAVIQYGRDCSAGG